ncbi:DNA-directed RNA polymerase subunit delta [Facklamia sp. DSM 111018]|uniref:Probable DNA-directed RNA polymerase subunit delta n=1 Tax=Facklamia lactis TaxID=2749967 RepID=A0ABS0LSK9_9LACT|nr:DNA-directed RNA polymerase subunit delta [Facklamia lactis]MBG9981405.1 DNA-directed RNA polymerase subunit delta [Facklamia lactis]MBG9987119.1 DNA-directed RNA polymerase subunit delta [Facklamia lactis]
MELKCFEGQLKEELSLIEVAHAILEDRGEVVDFTELLLEIQNYLGLSETYIESKMTRFYTDLNIDGRFISLGDNRWGLRAWYAIDEIDEEIITSSEEETTKRRKKKSGKVNAFADDSDDMIDYNDDDPEDGDHAYDEYDGDEEDEEEEEEPIEILVADVEEVDEDEELNEYASDLSELGDDDLEIDEESEFDEVDEDLDDELEEEDDSFEEDVDDED